MAKEKLIVLGGGCSAMAAVFGITDRAGWQDKFDITVYQPGWRLGGKGAAGRNAKMGQRIEEHGLHMLMGCYQNAFATLEWANAPVQLTRYNGQPAVELQGGAAPGVSSGAAMEAILRG